MVFSSTTFVFIFLPLVILLYYNPVFKSRKFKNILLLIASLGFYAWGEPIFVFLMIFSIIVAWGIGLLMEKKKSKLLLWISTIYFVAILFVFKYLSFVVREISLLGGKQSTFSIALPIGISFFSFQLMSYIFDVYYGSAKAQHSVFSLGLYISLFPQLIAGPIVRYSDIEDQIDGRTDSWNNLFEGANRFIWGLAKKVLLADYLAVIADKSFATIADQSVLMAWLGAVAYTLQIYFDFSGYSDMAIGLGRIFGFHFMENFNYPYISKSVTEFWRRWHISLSSWFRDYVYIPLGGNRCSKAKWIRNMFIVWALTGIWHGANWTFLIWGLLYFVFLLVEKLTGIDQKLGWFSYITTGVIVILCWVVFRAESLTDAIAYWGNMFGISSTKGFYNIDFVSFGKASLPVFIFAVIGMTPAVKKLFEFLSKKKLGWIYSIYTVFLFALSVIHIVASTYSPFIYFNF